VEGRIDPEKGWVLDFADLRRIVAEKVIRRCDLKNLNTDVPFLRGVNPTAENIAVKIWEELGRSSRRRASSGSSFTRPSGTRSSIRGRSREAMRVLISNDDGIHSPGLAALEGAARAMGFETFIVAPDREQSASSHALTMHRPLRCGRSPSAPGPWTDPTDCVTSRLQHPEEDPSRPRPLGINAGPNLGTT